MANKKQKENNKKIKGKFRKYLRKLENYPTWRFILEVTLLSIVLKAIMAFILALVELIPYLRYEPPFSDELIESVTLFDPFSVILIVLIVLIFPFLETIFLQIIPIKIVKLFTKKYLFQITISALVFSLAHGLYGFFITLPSGILFAYSFIIQEKKSFWKGLWVTSVIHGFSNIIALIISLSILWYPA